MRSFWSLILRPRELVFFALPESIVVVAISGNVCGLAVHP